MKRITALLIAFCVLIGGMTAFAADETGALTIALGDAEYTVNSTPADAPAAGEVGVKIPAFNYQDTGTVGLTLVLAAYGTGGDLVNMAAAKADIAAQTPELFISATITLGENQNLKYYVIDNFGSLMAVGNVPPSVPTDISADKITNSTVSISWEPSKDDAGMVKSYEIYRDGKLVGETDTTTFTDVGIRHNTTSKYQVLAVDAAGAKSEMSAQRTVKTKDIARISFGDLQMGMEFASDTTLAGHNMSIIGTAVGEGQSSSATALPVTASQYAVADDTSSLVGNATAKLGFTTLALNGLHSVVRFGLDRAYGQTLASNGDSDDVKFIINYYNHNWAASTGAWLRWRMSASDANTTGYLVMPVASTQKWQTAVYTIKNNSEVDNRKTWEFTPSDASIPSLTIESRDGGNDANKVLYLGKIDVVDENYVPYGAVLDFDEEGETQFVKFFRRNGHNSHEITTLDGKRAMKIPYHSAGSVYNSLYMGIDDNYLSTDAQDYIVRVTYYDDGAIRENKLVLWYDGASANGQLSLPASDGTIGWKTAELNLENVQLVNTEQGHWAIRVYNADDTDTSGKYVSRIEVIKRNPPELN